MTKGKTRRSFIKKMALSSSIIPSFPYLISDNYTQKLILDRSYEFENFTSNDQINIALIGCGIQGIINTNVALQVPGVKLIAVCDLYNGRLDRAKELWGKDLFVSRDYRLILNRTDVDAVIVACSNLQRPYPAIAIEVQEALGIEGFAYDMNVACSSATFGLQAAVNSVENGAARSVLVVSPEICSGHLNFRDRDSHFIFGDACTAILVEREEDTKAGQGFEILGTRLKTKFSNNIRNNFGFLNRADESGIGKPDKLFVQQGRKVFKEVSPLVAETIQGHLESLSLSPDNLTRMWLHQANLNMNQLIARKVLGRDATVEEAPVILDEYANTSSAGSIIAFHKYKDDLKAGDLGVICSFGAGYSIGSVVVRHR